MPAASSASASIETVIPRSVRVSEAPSHGKPVHDLRSDGRQGAQAYARLGARGGATISPSHSPCKPKLSSETRAPAASAAVWRPLLGEEPCQRPMPRPLACCRSAPSRAPITFQPRGADRRRRIWTELAGRPFAPARCACNRFFVRPSASQLDDATRSWLGNAGGAPPTLVGRDDDPLLHPRHARHRSASAAASGREPATQRPQCDRGGGRLQETDRRFRPHAGGA